MSAGHKPEADEAMQNALADERAAFEAWFCMAYHHTSLQPMEDGCYLNLGAGMAWDAWQSQQRELDRYTFLSVEEYGMPPCDGETVFVGFNSAGFAACFNHINPDGCCLMGSAESCTAQMSELRYWRVLERPSA